MSSSGKFQNERVTLDGKTRASVNLKSLDTLWFNTGTQCNLSCENCYIESSPTNDRLSYLSHADVEPYLQEIKDSKLGTKLIALTGGEPFLNPNIIPILEAILSEGHDLLILTNANRVLKRHQESLLKLKSEHGEKLHLRVSLDHYTAEKHDQERGIGAFERTTKELQWLFRNGFNISIAGRSLAEETQEESMAGHENLLKELEIKLNLKEKLVIFPEMRSKKDVPEITTECWGILSKSPDQQMCASERMVVKRKGEATPIVMPCTLLAYDDKFVLGQTLKDANTEVYLNHRFCAEFCVLGGASCSSTK